MSIEPANPNTPSFASAGSGRGHLTTRLDRLPWGRFHTVVTGALALGWALDMFEATIIGSVLGQVTRLWKLTATQGSALVSSWVLGIFLGAIVFGHYSDRFGRKKLFMVTLLVYLVATAATAASWDFASFAFFRFLTGAGIGGE